MVYKPSIFTVETVLGCNLKCPGCACGGDFIKRKNQIMKWDDFVIIADKIKPFAKYVFLHCWGEPLLNPRIIDMIEYLKPIKSHVSTNGQTITDLLAKQLGESGADICVSLDGYSQEIYEIYRQGGKVEKAYKAVELLHKYGNVSSRYVVFEHNVHELPLYKKKMNEIGVANAEGKTSYILTDDLKPAKGWERKTTKIPKGSCNDLINVMTIFANGDVVPCCYIYNSDVVFGNLLTDDVLTAYNNEKINKYRELLKKGNNLLCNKYCKI